MSIEINKVTRHIKVTQDRREIKVHPVVRKIEVHQVGRRGPQGADSTVPGPAGDSAYQIWLDNGHTGTEADFLASLVGPEGDPGTPGVVQTIVAGDGVTVDDSDPANPIVSVESGSGVWGSITGDIEDQTDLIDLLDEKQPLDGDLTAIAGLSPANNDIIQRKSGAWTNRTIAQFKSDLSLVKGDVGLGNVDNTSDANKPVSTAQALAIAVVQGDLDAHEANTSNPHNVTKDQVGLGNATNTSDADKPVSTATQTALDAKVDENAPITGATKTKVTYDAKGLVTGGADATTADIADSSNKRYVTDAQLVVIGNTSGTNTGDQDLSGLVPNTRTVNGHALSANVTITKGDVGLGNVDNTADADKPISDDTQDALDGKQSLSEKGQVSGYASLDGSGKVPAAQLPAIAISEVFVVANQAAQLALTAEEGDIAIRTDQSKTYINNGGTSGTMTDWTELQSPTDAVSSVNGRVGAVTGLAEDSDLQAHIDDVANPHSVTKAQVGLGNADNTSDADKPISTATQTALDLKAPIASPTFTGTVTIPSGASITSPTIITPTISATGWTNAQHQHGSANQGGTLNASAISAGTLPLARGGTGASLTDPNVDRILFWDDSAGAMTWLEVGSGLSITGTVISASGGSGATTALDNLASVAINAALLPATSDAIALGSAAKQWSDLFLGEGGAINWDNGDAAITQSGNFITVTGAALEVTDPGTSSNSVVTIAGVQTLTDKTLDGDNNTFVDVPISALKANYSFHAYRNAAKTIGSSLVDAVHDTERYDPNANFNTTTGVYTCPVAGKYRFEAALSCGAAVNTRAIISVVGSTFGARILTDVTATQIRKINGAIEIDCQAGETVKVQYFCAVNTDVASTESWFAGSFLGS